VQKKTLTIFNIPSTPNQTRIEAEFLTILKVIYRKHTANILLNMEKLKVFHLKIGAKQGNL
jgi:hypothetical protein